MVEINPVLDPSRIQFAMTVLYHFLFVPLTLGLIVIIAIMETIYVKTSKEIYKDMARFWAKLFGINFALGVTTGITMEFQFGTNWSYYSHFVGDIFGAPLAIEALMAFFLESTLVGLMFFGWDRMGKKTHCAVTWFTALGTNLSALWILVANGWMQFPTGSKINPITMRHEVVDFLNVVLSPVAQAKFIHTVMAGYVCGAVFVLAISSYYMIKGRDIEFARKSFTVAAIFGLVASLAVVLLGHESGVHVNEYQPAKMAAIEGHYEGVDGCIDFKLIAWPSYSGGVYNENDSWLSIPCGTSLVNYYKLTLNKEKGEVILGAKELVEINKGRIKNGIVADLALKKIQAGDDSVATRKIFDDNAHDWGYGQLLKAFIPNTRGIETATVAEINLAAESTIPPMPTLFWAFRIMVACGMLLILLFALATLAVLTRRVGKGGLLPRLALFALPLPWIAIESGWWVAEYGRQPWAIDGVLPTFLAVSGITTAEIWFTLIAMVGLYTIFLIVEVYLMLKYVKLGPSSLGTGRYHSEKRDNSREVK